MTSPPSPMTEQELIKGSEILAARDPDLALHKAVQNLKGFETPLSPSEFEELGEPWRPWRSVAARILWNHYLNTPPSDPTP